MRFTTVGLALLIAAPVMGQELPSPREIAAEARPAVVSIRGLIGGELEGSGSGFVVRSDGVIITNLHVAHGVESLEVELESGEIYDQIYVLAQDERRDLLLLQIPAVGLETIRIGDDRGLEVGDPVYTVGNPMGLNWTFSDGLLSAKRTVEGVTYLQISAPISRGSSGGPVLDHRGVAIGVATLTFEGGQNLNLAVPARHAEGMLALARDPRPFLEVAEEWGVARPRPTTAGLSGSVAEAADRLGLDREYRAALAELSPWQQVVAVQILVLRMLLAEEGWSTFGEVSFGYLEAGDFEGVEVSLRPGNYIAVAACDDDCTDMDLAVFDQGAEEVGSDFLADAMPFVDFTVARSGRFHIVAAMAECGVEPCFYGIQLFRKP